MSTTALAEMEELKVENENLVRMPHGLLGFEDQKEYVLLENPDEKPFVWLQSIKQNDLAFLLIPPDCIVDDYHPNISDQDVNTLGLSAPDDALIYNIVTVHTDGSFTANLKGPIVLNRFNLQAKQVVPENVSEFSLRHTLPINSNN